MAMSRAHRYFLVKGPYRSVRAKVGVPIADRIRGEVTPDGITEGHRSTADGVPLAWPYTTGPGGSITLVVCADMERAVRIESVQAVAQIWGVHRKTAYRWRRALGVGRATPGTRMEMAKASMSRRDRRSKK